jgi:hypothetical protein
MSTQFYTDNIESYITDLLGGQSSDYNDNYEEEIDSTYHGSHDSTAEVVPESLSLPVDDKYLSFAVGGSDFLIAANQVVSVKSFVNEGGYRDYHLYRVEELLNINQSMDSSQPQFVLILRSEKDYAIRVDTIHGLVTVPAERLLIRKKVKDRPWYTAISRDFQSALLNSYTLGKSLLTI